MIRMILSFAFAAAYLIIGIPVLGIFWIIGKFNKPAADLGQLRCVQWGLRVIGIGICRTNLEVIGLENVPRDTAVLYVSNHRSYFDIILSYSLCPGLTGYTAKSSIEKVPLLVTWMRRLYCLFIDRDDVKQSLKSILKGIEHVKNGVSICIFPEGTRSKTDQLLPFKEGSMKIASKTGCPIIPMAISGARAVWEDQFPKVKAHQHVIIEYGKPIYPKELPKEQQKTLGAYTQAIIQEMLDNHKSMM